MCGPILRRRAVYVVPLRIGGGTRLKIFEAMAMGKAVVSTTVGAEGLPVTPGSDIVIADEPDAFARAVVDMIRDADDAGASRPRPVGSSSNATTGPRSPRISRSATGPARRRPSTAAPAHRVSGRRRGCRNPT